MHCNGLALTPPPPPIQPVVRQTDLSKECPFKVVNKSRSSLYNSMSGMLNKPGLLTHLDFSLQCAHV